MKKGTANRGLKLSPVLIFGLAVGLQLILLLLLPLPRWLTMINGQTILLETKPVDPYSITGGYYIALSYAIADPSNLPGKEVALKQGQNYYILLAPDAQGIWQPQRVLKQLPTHLNPNEVAIRGKYDYLFEYGIEHYYLPETKRHQLEDLTSAGFWSAGNQRTGERGPEDLPKVLVEVKVDRQGRSAIMKLIVGEQSFEY